MKHLSLLALALMPLACGKKEVKPVTVVATEEELAKYKEAAARISDFTFDGFVVSKSAVDSSHLSKGDSLLFSGLALYALSCKDGQGIADAFAKMLKDKDGAVYRHPDLPTDEVSLDGLLGMYRGIIKRVKVCGEKELWKPLMVHHKSRMAASLPAEFNLVCDTLLHELDLAGAPDSKRLGYLANEVSAWSSLVRDSRSACYRIHLGLIALQAMNELGYPVSEQARGDYAKATSGVKIATVDEFSGRGGLKDYLLNFQYNEWQYAHQRCPVWENKDGKGDLHPAVDYLVAFADYHGSPQ